MNPKIIVGIVVAAFVGVVGIIALSDQSLISDILEEGIFSKLDTEAQILPIEIELDDLSVLEVTERAVTLEIKFKVTNPNNRSVILQYITYELFEQDLRVDAGEIGARFAGFIATSNYFVILNDAPTFLSEKITIKNTGNTPEFWSALMNNTPEWTVKGEAFFNLSSMTRGGENQVTFEFTK